MLFASHAILAGTIGSKINSPMPAFLVGVILHFILDAMPHYDTTDGGKFTFRQNALIGADLIIFAIIILWLRPTSHAFWWGALGGILPDILDYCPIWKKKLRGTGFGKFFHKLHEGVHWHSAGPFLGIMAQIAVIIISIYLYRR